VTFFLRGEEKKDFKPNTPIFLDTNILLKKSLPHVIQNETGISTKEQSLTDFFQYPGFFALYKRVLNSQARTDRPHESAIFEFFETVIEIKHHATFVSFCC
jgi:hypothetical protein